MVSTGSGRKVHRIMLGASGNLTFPWAPVGTLLSLELAEEFLRVAPDLHCSFGADVLCRHRRREGQPTFAEPKQRRKAAGSCNKSHLLSSSRPAHIV